MSNSSPLKVSHDRNYSLIKLCTKNDSGFYWFGSSLQKKIFAKNVGGKLIFHCTFFLLAHFNEQIAMVLHYEYIIIIIKTMQIFT